MNHEIYKVEKNHNPIFITITVSTAGIAETEVAKYSMPLKIPLMLLGLCQKHR